MNDFIQTDENGAFYVDARDNDVDVSYVSVGGEFTYAELTVIPEHEYAECLYLKLNAKQCRELSEMLEGTADFLEGK